MSAGIPSRETLENADIADALIAVLGTSRPDLVENIRTPEQMLALLKRRLSAQPTHRRD